MRKEKVGIISIHYGVNFGSALQAIALSQYLKQNFEFECVDVINYIPKRFKRINRLKNISGHGAKYFMHGLIRMSRFEKTNKKYISPCSLIPCIFPKAKKGHKKHRQNNICTIRFRFIGSPKQKLGGCIP